MTCCLSWSQDLDDYKWENRLLFFIAKNNESPSLQKNVRIFTEKDYELTDRDLIILIMNPTNVFNADGSKSNIKPEQVYERFKLISDYEGILLIGKDGGIKLKKQFQVKPEIIFNTIDGMPMRQSELRSRKN
ncbi:DUF4174 domain-containing protein [Zobellia amurskyensis]|nr:DUF4174 domain-containing protein [Zobellia amurskyensis]